MQQGGFRHIAVHNGVFCGDSKYLLEGGGGGRHLAAIVLLTDQYRPGVDISRSEIREISLEMACDMVLIQEELAQTGYEVSSGSEARLKDKPWMIPTSVYQDLVQKRPDLEKRVVANIEDCQYGWNEIQEQILQQKELFLRWTTLSFDAKMNLKRQLFLACLKLHYDVNVDMNGYDNEIYIREQIEEQTELHDAIFPPSLFLYPKQECRYLTRSWSDGRHFCNADHRLSRFMLENADLLQQKFPGMLKEMIRILQEESGEELISGVNDLLNCLRSLPGQYIQVPSDLCLTTEDLYYAK